jgi:TonB-dependent starch-binding outer membrane protein SusC
MAFPANLTFIYFFISLIVYMKSGLPTRILFLLPFLFWLILPLSSQIKVTGLVKSADDGEPLPAIIKIRGMNPPVTSQADIDGNFTIIANSPMDELEIIMSNYVTRYMPIGNNTFFIISMNPVSTMLNDVIIIAYDTKQNSKKTEGADNISIGKLKEVPGGGIDKMLDGNSALYITSNGAPGRAASLRLRGISSINSNSEPLIVLDGLPLDDQVEIGGISTIFSINPDDIENITILKDASATAMYGARGANGVIMIQTKRGKRGISKPVVTFSSYAGFSVNPKKMSVMNSDQYSRYMDSLYTHNNLPVPGAFSNIFRERNGNTNTDWQDAITQKGAMRNYTLNIMSGGQKSNYNLSGNYYNEKGTLITTGTEKYSFRINSDFTVSKRIRMGESMSLNRINSQLPSISNPWSLSCIAPPVMPIYNPQNIGGYAGPTDSTTANYNNSNPVAELRLKNLESQLSRLIGDAYIEVELLKGLTYKIDAGYDYSYNHVQSWNPEYSLGNKGNVSNFTASLTEMHNINSMYKFDNLITYKFSFGSNTVEKYRDSISQSTETVSAEKNHNFILLAGHSAQNFRTEYYSSTGKGFNFPNLNVLDMADSAGKPGGGVLEHSIESYLSRVMYDFKGKYLFTASLRCDGSSKFSPEHRWGYFPAFSLGWKINEDFLKKYKESTINMIKLRVGWGQTGNQNFPPFMNKEYLDPITHSRYAFGTSQTVYRGYQLYSSTGNPNLVWEASTMTNIGADFSLFRHKLEFNVDYYIKNQRRMLVKQMLPLIYGRDSIANPWVNLGQVQNRGVEINVCFRDDIKNIGRSVLEYSFGANITTIKNEVLSLPAGNIYNSVGDFTSITTTGHTIGSFYGFVADGLFQNEEEIKKSPYQYPNTKPGDIKFKDLNGDGKIDYQDRTIIGKAIPDFIYGISFYCRYRDFDFNILFQGVKNVQIYNTLRANLYLSHNQKSENRMTDVLNYWSAENPNSSVPGLSYNDNNNNARFSTFFLEDGSYLRLRNLQLGYNFKEIKLKKYNISKLRLYISGSNLLTFTNYKGYDPEIITFNPLVANLDYGTYPIPKIYIMGFQIEF